jgi:lipid A disaccharide synthetase
MIIKEVVNRNLNKQNLLEAFDILLNDRNFRDKQILEIQKYLPEIQNKSNPYDICEKRINEIISTTT